MYFDTRDSQGFLHSELNGLRTARDSAIATRDYARAASNRANADSQRLCHDGDAAADQRALATRERFRAAHKQACALKDEVSEVEYDIVFDGYEDDDLDEYGYAA